MDAVLIQLGKNLGLDYSKDYLTLNGEYKKVKLYINKYSNINSYTLKFPFTLDKDSANDITLNLIDFIRSKYANVSKCTLDDTTIFISLTGSNNEDEDINTITNIINEVCDFAETNKLSSCCEVCKLNLPTKLHDFNNSLFLMCDNCNENLQKSAVKNHNKSLKDSNIITGIIGALLGSLIGVALWVVVFQLGYIASICGMVIAICAMKGFELFGGRLNKSGIIITLIITIAMVYLSNYLSYSIDVYNAFKATEDITVFDCIRNLGNLFTEFPDLKSEFTKNLLMGYGFTLLGTFSMFKNALKSKG